MTTRSEDVLLASLTDTDSLEALARIGLEPESIPTDLVREMVAWGLNEFFRSGRVQAPSREMLLLVWGQSIEDAEIELLDEDLEIDTIQSAIDNLKDLHASRAWQEWFKDSATEMASALPTTKVATLTEVTNRLFAVTSVLQDHSSRATVQEGFGASLADYQQRASEEAEVRGMTFGIEAIDQHTFGIHPGEMAVLAAGPKVGKSFFAARTARHSFFDRARHSVLFTLENSVEMTMDRLVCLHLGINPRAYQRGQVDPEQAAMVAKFIAEELPEREGMLHVISPPRGSRTPEMLIREAKMLGAQEVILDQLTHVEHPDPGRKPRHEIFNENIHEFHDLINDGDKIPLLVLHQISRAGVEAAKKREGFHDMHDMAESAGIERASSWAFALSQSGQERVAKVAKFQVMASRREDTKSWQIMWDPERGGCKARKEISPP